MVDIVYTPLNEGKPEIYPIAKPKIRWEELAILYGKRITASKNAPTINEYADVYVVPEGKVFFLLTANLSIANASASRSSGRFFIRFPGEINTSLRTIMTLNCMPQGQNSSTMSFSVPLLVQFGESVGIYNDDASSTTLGQVNGYEIDSNLFQTLF